MTVIEDRHRVAALVDDVDIAAVGVDDRIDRRGADRHRIGHHIGVGVDDGQRAIHPIGQVGAMVDGVYGHEIRNPPAAYALPRGNRLDHGVGRGIDHRNGLVGHIVDIDLGVLRVDRRSDRAIAHRNRLEHRMRLLVDHGDRVIGGVRHVELLQDVVRSR